MPGEEEQGRNGPVAIGGWIDSSVVGRGQLDGTELGTRDSGLGTRDSGQVPP
jgi:hypothetical protein